MKSTLLSALAAAIVVASGATMSAQTKTLTREAKTITATVEAILAQRLVRRICMNCREENAPSAEMLADLSLSPDDVADKIFYKGRGCEVCNNTGYKGRVGLFELMIMSDELRDKIMNNAQADELREIARKQGMVALRDAGIKACFDGVTTPDEVVRETIVDA